MPHELDDLDLATDDRRAGEGSPLLAAHRALRGRYKIALLLAVLLAVPLAAAGWAVRGPEYTSRGAVSIAPTRTVILQENELNQPLPFFEQFVQQQAQLLGNQRTLEAAVGDPKLAEAGWPAGVDGLALLMRRLHVEQPQRSPVIGLSVRHADPVMAREAVNAVLRAYEARHREGAQSEYSRREQALVALQRELRGEVSGKLEQAQRLAERYGTDDLEAYAAAKRAARIRVENEIAELELEIATRRDLPGAAPDFAEGLSLNQLADRDPQLAALLLARGALVTTRDQLAARLGEQHPEMRRVARELASTEAQIAARAEIARTLPLPAGAAGRLAAEPIEELEARLARLRERHDAVSREAVEIGQTQMRIARFRREAALAEEELERTTARLEGLRLERQDNEAPGRAEIHWASTPLEPSSDRRLLLAAAGGGFGLVLGFGLVGAFGVVRGEYRYIDDLEAGPNPLPIIGIVPELGDGEDAEEAGLSLHQARALLECRICPERPDGAGRVITFTSGAPGDGKTTLTLALAASLATAGNRVCVVDGDLVGRGLSVQMGLRQNAGLAEAVAAEHVNGEVVGTRRENLWVLPAGASEDFDPASLSGRRLRGLVAELRSRFDFVLIDTGPVLGSVEAAAAAPLSDAVVLVTSRGQSPRRVRAAAERLESLGANLAGVVFNRALASDFVRSVRTSNISHQSVREVKPGRRALARAGVGDED